MVEKIYEEKHLDNAQFIQDYKLKFELFSKHLESINLPFGSSLWMLVTPLNKSAIHDSLNGCCFK